VSQQPIPVVYGTIRIDIGFRANLIVEDKVIAARTPRTPIRLRASASRRFEVEDLARRFTVASS
jgi:hypothetical protein